ncbi:hypothetical protein [Pseudacidovorax sp. RU35E]|uniref:hypothetical protein n=1 Tax=Pseudacidovorax sp. RU35E TaxID=1907403 RepID=UPI000955FB2C|nr:hypothetical protein [Pseudacidovorax sp. RU35E]SIR00831.1 hypothetical protein SAMN05880557_107107 [Pseudacidovorax sp. RU35E]
MELTSPAAHASAPGADLFGDGTVTIEIRGRLSQDAQIRHKPAGDGQHTVPVLCLEIEPLSAAGHHYHAEQVYTETTLALAEERARALRKGTHITLTTPWAGTRVIFPRVQTIHTKEA